LHDERARITNERKAIVQMSDSCLKILRTREHCLLSTSCFRIKNTEKATFRRYVHQRKC